jgi:MFS family permease
MAPLTLMTTLTATAVFGIRPMVSYRALDLDASTAELGIVASSFAAVAILIAIPLGRAIDRIGERRVIQAGVLVVAAACGAVPFATSVPVLAATQALLGVGQLMVVVASHTVIANHGSDSGRANRFGVYTSMASLGHAIGPAAGGALTGAGLTDAPFFAGAGVALVALAASPFVPSAAGTHATAAEGATRGIGRALRLPGMKTAMLSGIVVLTSVDVLVAYLPAYGEERGVAPAVIGIALAVMALAQMGSRLTLGPLVTRFGHAAPLAGSMALAAVALPFLGLPVGAIGLVVLLAFVGAGLGLGQPLSLAWVAMMTPQPLRGTAMGIRMGGNRFGQLVLPAVIGATAGQAGTIAVMWSLTAVLGATAGFVGASRRNLDVAAVATSGTEEPA